MEFSKIEGASLSDGEARAAVDFFYDNLGEFRDPREQTEDCLAYLRDSTKGGYLFRVTDEGRAIGQTILLKTRMERFLPPYLLVYIAVDSNVRGRGIGEKLLEYVQRDLDAPIALHVEPHNPAVSLYERLGFTTKYNEMRWRY